MKPKINVNPGMAALVVLLGVIWTSAGVFAQEAETTPTRDDIIAQMDALREQLRNNPATEELSTRLQELREQLRTDRWNADLVAEMAILRYRVRELENPALVEQMNALRMQLGAIMQEDGGIGRMRGPRFVDMDGDGVNDGVQRGIPGPGARGLGRGMSPGLGRGLAEGQIFTDTDGDGVVDEVLVDTDGDGIGDGTLQEFLQDRWQQLDQDGDGVPDVRPGMRGRRGGKAGRGAGQGNR